MKKCISWFLSLVLLLSCCSGIVLPADATEQIQTMTAEEVGSVEEARLAAKLPTKVTSPNEFEYSVTNGEVTISDYIGSSTVVVIPSVIDGYPVTSIGVSTFDFCSSLTSITIPDSVNSIGDRAFFYCASLTSITIPASVTSIGEGAFQCCSSLTTITIPESVTSIGVSTFTFCSSLTSITIPDSVTSISDRAFFGCSSLTSITIPESVTSIGSYVFYNCDSLTDVYYTGTQEQWDEIAIAKGNEPLLNAKFTVNYKAHACKEYGQWIVSKEPTLTAAGERYLVCSQCGATVTEAIDMLIGDVEQWNITLQDDFKVKFRLKVSESIASTAKVTMMIGSNPASYDLSSLQKTEDGCYLLDARISAAQMNDTISVQIINGEDKGEVLTYTVREYCDTILTDDAQSQYHALVKEMLNYGAMAQAYFDYDTENPANDGITDAAAVEVPETVTEMAVTDKLSGLSFYGASLVYRDRIAVRYYFTGDVTGLVFTANDKTYTPVSKDGMYYIEIADILPQNLDEQITLNVMDANGDNLSVTYSPMNYIVRMNAKGNEKLKNLLKALYNYHLAAKAL